MTPIYIVKIVDGLGNQMFEYAWARAMQSKYGGKIILDGHSFKKNRLRCLSLNNFILNSNVRTASSFWDKILVYSLGAYKKVVDLIYKKDDFDTYIKKAKLGIYEQISNNWYDSMIKPSSKFNYIEGTWMSESWFKSEVETIKKDYTIRIPATSTSEEIIQEMNNCNSVCIHIRLGDYLAEPYNSMSRVCGNDYYNEAIRIIKEKVDKPVFYVFTNRPKDFEYIQNNFRFDTDVKLMNNGNPDYEDLRLMCSCKHQIMSNSTFSWWAQYLNPYPSKIIVAPCMHNKHNKWNLQCLFLDSWVLVGPEHLDLNGFSATESVNSVSPKMPWARVIKAAQEQNKD